MTFVNIEKPRRGERDIACTNDTPGLSYHTNLTLNRAEKRREAPDIENTLRYEDTYPLPKAMCMDLCSSLAVPRCPILVQGVSG